MKGAISLYWAVMVGMCLTALVLVYSWVLNWR